MKSLLYLIPFLLCTARLYAQPAGWSVATESCQFSMTMVAQIQVNGEPDHLLNNHVAVYHQGQIRGYATPMPDNNGQAFYFLNLCSDTYKGDTLYFRAFRGADNKVYESVDTVVFRHQQALGSIPNPFQIRFTLGERPLIYSLATANYAAGTCNDVLDVEATDNQDSEGNGLAYSITGGTDAVRFSIHPVTGLLSWNNFIPDVANPLDDNMDNRYEVEVRVTDASNRFDVQRITVTVVNDAPTPPLVCPTNQTYATSNAGDCGAEANQTWVQLPNLCALSGLTYQLTGATSGNGSGHIPQGQSFNKGTTTAKYTMGGANPSTCSFTVTVTDNFGPTVTCPADLSVNTGNGLCTATVNDIDATDNCPSETLAYAFTGATTDSGSEQASGSTFEKGVTTVTYTVTDAANRTQTCSFTVTVLDNQDPTVTCPANLPVNTDNGFCTATVNDIDATFGDNCPGETLAYAFSGATSGSGSGQAGGNMFEKGATTVTYTVTDAANRTKTCSFTVTVTDNEDPTVSCPSNQPVNTDNGACSAVVNGINATFDDNCPGETLAHALTGVTTGNGSGQANGAFNKGVTTVTYTVTDAANRTKSCSFTVTVTDNQDPTVSCPTNQSVDTGNGVCSAVVNDIDATFDDNCPGESLAYALTGATTGSGSGQASGSTFEKGVTTVTYTVTDAANRTKTCSFTVTVTDNQDPTVTCPSNQNVTPGVNPCVAVFNNINATFEDNCPGETLAYAFTGATTGSGSGQASGQTFEGGVTTVTYTVTDAANRMKTCSFTITVNCVIISGTISWSTNPSLGVKDATVTASGPANGSDATDVNGNYDVIFGLSGTYTVTPTKNINKFNGVTAADATRVQQHVSGSSPLGAPFPRIAADVNKSNSITTADAGLITQALLGNPAANSIWNTSWRFADADYVFPNPNAPWNFPQSVSLTGVNGGPVTDVDFIGIKLGDVASPYANPQQRPAPVVLRAPERVLQTGDRVEVALVVDGYADVAAFQFVLRFDPEKLAFGSIQTPPGGLLTNEHFGTAQAADGELRVVLAKPQGETLPDGTAFFTLAFTATASGDLLSSLLALSEEEMPALAYTTELYPQPIQLVFGQASTSATNPVREGLTLSARPNPASGQTTLRFYLPAATDAQLRLLDAQGRLVSAYDGYFQAGAFEQRVELPVAGLYFAELITPYGTVVCKVVGE